MANVEVFAEEKEGMNEAMRRINLIAYPPTAEVGETYEGKVKNIVAFGAFLEILPSFEVKKPLISRVYDIVVLQKSFSSYPMWNHDSLKINGI